MRTIKFWLIPALGAAFTLGAAGCRQAPVSPMAPAAPTVAAGPLWEEPQFTAMLRAYRDKVDRKSRVLRFEMNETHASLQVEGSTRVPSAASYEYESGALKGPAPFDPLGEFVNPNLDDDVFDWSQVALERIPSLVSAAPAQTKIAGAKVVKVEIARRSPGTEDIAARVDALVDARGRAMEQKLHQAEKNPAGSDPKADSKADTKPEPRGAEPGLAVSPMDVLQIAVLLRSPGGMSWVTADANGKITGSGDGILSGFDADLHQGRPRFDGAHPVSTARPYWRRAAGLKP